MTSEGTPVETIMKMVGMHLGIRWLLINEYYYMSVADKLRTNDALRDFLGT